MITLNKDRKQTKYGHKRQEHMTHTTEPWQKACNLLKIFSSSLKSIYVNEHISASRIKSPCVIVLKQVKMLSHVVNIIVHSVTVFLSRFGAFLRSEIKFSKLLVQPPHHLVTCAHHKISFSFFWTSCDCFGTFMQLIMYICLRCPTLSVANVMLLKIYYIVLCAIVLPLKTSSR